MSDIEARVRDAIRMNVDLMDGPSRIVEGALASAGRVDKRRRRRRALAGALVVVAVVGTLAGVAVAARHHDRGITVTAGASTTTQSSPNATALRPSVLVAKWNADCGIAPQLSPIAGLRFTLELTSRMVTPGSSARATIVFENPTDHEIQFGTGIGAWYVTTPGGRVVGTSAGYPVVTIGYGVAVSAHDRLLPSQPSASFGASTGACSGSGPTPSQSPPLPRGHYLAWFGVPTTPGAMFISEPTPFDVGGAPVWNVPVTRAQALAKGRLDAIDPNTAIVQAKLASWVEIQAAGANPGTRPNDDPERRVWVVSVSGEVHRGMCCIVKEPPFRWGVVFIDASTGALFQYNAGWKGDIAPWFARLPDHGA